MKLQRPFKILLLSALGLCFLSGVLWWVFNTWVRVSGALGEEHHPLQVWFIRFHSATAFILLLALGYLIEVHIEPGLKKKKRKKSGLSLVGFFLILIITALPILYATEGFLRSSSSFTHTYVGLALPLFLGLHIYGFRKN